MLKYRKHIIGYALVSVLPALLFALVVLRLDVGRSCSKWIWIPLVVLLGGAFGAEFLGKWLKKRLSGVMPRERLEINLVVLVSSMVSLGFNAAALILTYLTGNKLVALLLIAIGLIDAALSARSIVLNNKEQSAG